MVKMAIKVTFYFNINNCIHIIDRHFPQLFFLFVLIGCKLFSPRVNESSPILKLIKYFQAVRSLLMLVTVGALRQ